MRVYGRYKRFKRRRKSGYAKRRRGSAGRLTRGRRGGVRL